MIIWVTLSPIYVQAVPEMVYVCNVNIYRDMPPPDFTCDNPDCDNITPVDMVAIRIDSQTFCSPDCARIHLQTISEIPDSVVLQDPQFVVPRDDLPDTDDTSIGIRFDVTDKSDALTALNEIETMYPHDFRQ